MIITDADVWNRQSPEFKLHREGGRWDYLFVLFKSPAYVNVRGEYVKVDNGSCIFFDKYKIQSYFPCPPLEFLHDYMHFDLESDFEKMLFDDIPKGEPLSLSLPERITGVLKEMKDELRGNPSEYRRDILNGLGNVFLYRIKSEIEQDDIGIRKRTVFKNLYQLRKEIYHNPREEWNVDQMSRRVCLSRSYFQHLYKDFFGVTCIEDVISARIAAAKSLLTRSDFLVSEIAEKCGYQSTSHFIRQFKKETGVTPDKFREEGTISPERK